LIVFVLLIFSGILHQSCKKDYTEKPTKLLNKENSSKPIVFDIMDSKGAKSENFTKTVLGNQRNNPFTTKKMAEAYCSLYGDTTLSEMPTTDIYVELKPHSNAELQAIEEAGFICFDYPLDYEVITMGDYYQELPNEDDFPVLYSVIKPDIDIPIQDYTILENLYIDYSNPLLVGEAFRITGNTTDIDDLYGFTYDELGGDINIPYIINNPNLDCNPPCVIKYHEIISTINGQTHVVFTFADMRYPLSGQQSINQLYVDRLEETWNEELNHIPVGLYHDLIDGGTEPLISTDIFDANSTSITDNVFGFTNQQLFNCILSTTSTMNGYQQNVINFYLSSTSNSVTEVNMLFNSY